MDWARQLNEEIEKLMTYDKLTDPIATKLATYYMALQAIKGTKKDNAEMYADVDSPSLIKRTEADDAMSTILGDGTPETTILMYDIISRHIDDLQRIMPRMYQKILLELQEVSK